jgi:hypothetical protein
MEVADHYPPLEEELLGRLIARARDQRGALERQRLAASRHALGAADTHAIR